MLKLGSTSLTRTHLLFANNDTVPISVWRGGRMHSTECRLVFIAVYYWLLYLDSLHRYGLPLLTHCRTECDLV